MNDIPCASQFSVGWTHERVDLLRKLVVDNMSARQIAVEMGGNFSRNAIIGKCLRLGLRLNGQKPKRPVRPVEKITPQNYRAPRRRKAIAVLPPAPIPELIEHVLTPENHVSLIDAGYGQCRFPVDESKSGMICCGSEVVTQGISWCAGHLARVYTKEGLERFTKRQRMQAPA